MTLIDTGTCNNNKELHVKCNNPSWKRVCCLSFTQEQADASGIPDHGGAFPAFSFEDWFHDWDQTGSDDVHRLCQISWHASRGILVNPANPDRAKMLQLLTPKVEGGAPHGFGITLSGQFIRVDIGALGELIAKQQIEILELKKQLSEKA